MYLFLTWKLIHFYYEAMRDADEKKKTFMKDPWTRKIVFGIVKPVLLILFEDQFWMD